MTTVRRGPSAYRTKLLRGPAGQPLCRWCSLEVPKGRRTFCSEPCIDEWKIRSNPGHVAVLVFRRDRGICAVCHLDTVALGRRFRAWIHETTQSWWHGPFEFEGRRTPAKRVLWEADHIVPVVEGGGECGLENYQTLCLWCHRTATAELRRRLAQRKRPSRSRALNALAEKSDA